MKSKEETPVATDTQAPHHLTQETFPFVTPSPEMPNAFSFNLKPLESYPKGIHERGEALAERKPPKKSEGGNVERSYVKHSLNCN